MFAKENLLKRSLIILAVAVIALVIGTNFNFIYAQDKDDTTIPTGWTQSEDGTRYYYDENGNPFTGIQTLDGETYYFDEKTGAMHIGWAQFNSGRSYFDKSTGAMVRGWQKIGDFSYHFSAEGYMNKGWKKIGSYKYYFGNNGHMRKGWHKIGKYKYYFGNNGHMRKGWKKIGKHKYYFGNSSGHMFKGWHKIKGYKYYFGNNGHMRKGVQEIGKYKYYFNKHGRMCVGLHKNGTAIYNINANGHIKRVLYTDKKAIALTYDDGPAEGTQTIVDTLKAYDGAATFFIVGSRMSYYPDALKEAAKIGCQMANHTYGHEYLEGLSAEGIKSQIQRCNSIVKKYTGQTPTVCRTPGGGLSSTVRENVGMPIILWSIDTLDWKTHDANQTYNTVTNGAYDGAIVLMHDLWDATATASKSIIPELSRRGYQLVTVEELAMLKGVELEAGQVYYDIR